MKKILVGSLICQLFFLQGFSADKIELPEEELGSMNSGRRQNEQRRFASTLSQQSKQCVMLVSTNIRVTKYLYSVTDMTSSFLT